MQQKALKLVPIKFHDIGRGHNVGSILIKWNASKHRSKGFYVIYVFGPPNGRIAQINGGTTVLHLLKKNIKAQSLSRLESYLITNRLYTVPSKLKATK